MTRVDHLRVDYERAALSRADLDACPYTTFQTWLSLAMSSAQPEPTAMTLATVSPEGLPSARIVLLKGHDQRGMVFFTNYESRKAIELAQTGVACLCIFWSALERQIRVEGVVEKIAAEESDAYFDSRPRGSRVGAMASPQSRPVSGRAQLEARVREVEERFPDDVRLVRPQHWGGFRLRPNRWEFWQGRKSRLHDRFAYRLEDRGWSLTRLAP